MKVLGIDTSSLATSVAVIEDNKLKSEKLIKQAKALKVKKEKQNKSQETAAAS